VVKLLLAKGADVNARDKDNDTALMKAATQKFSFPGRAQGPADGDQFQKDVEIVQMLLARGADVNARGNNGGTALLFAASRGGDDSLVNALLAKGADVNAHNDAGLTPVILAAAYGRISTLDALFEHHADVNARTPKGFTALIAAANAGLANTVQLLVE